MPGTVPGGDGGAVAPCVGEDGVGVDGVGVPLGSRVRGGVGDVGGAGWTGVSTTCSGFSNAGDITGGEVGEALRMEGEGDKAFRCNGEMGVDVDDAGEIRLGGGERRSSSSPS